jgi:hypothetical protein
MVQAAVVRQGLGWSMTMSKKAGNNAQGSNTRDSANTTANSSSTRGVDEPTIDVSGRAIKIVEVGLDEQQVSAFVAELVTQRDALLKREEHLTSLSMLAERTVTEANNLAKEIKQKAAEDAKIEGDKIIAKISEKAEQMAAKQAEGILEEKTKLLHSEVKASAKQLYSGLYAQIENLKRQISEMEVDFDQALKKIDHPSFKPVSKEPDSAVNPAANANYTPGDAPQQTPAVSGKAANEAVQSSPEEDKNPLNGSLLVGLEILPPIDIHKILGIISSLEKYPEVRTTELIPLVPNPLITVFLSKPLSLVEVLNGLPAVQKAEEISEGEAISIPDGSVKNWQKRIQLVLRENAPTPKKQKAEAEAASSRTS